MVCPVCITTAIMANAPAIAASLGGVAAAKAVLNLRTSRAPVVCQRTGQTVQAGGATQPRTVLDPHKVMRYDEQEW